MYTVQHTRTGVCGVVNSLNLKYYMLCREYDTSAKTLKSRAPVEKTGECMLCKAIAQILLLT